MKIENIYTLQILKFYYKLQNDRLPMYFYQLPITPTSQIYDYNTRRNAFFVTRSAHTFATKCIRHEVIRVLNSTTELIKEKVYTHSYQGFSGYVKQSFIRKYQTSCNIVNCYICNSN